MGPTLVRDAERGSRISYFDIFRYLDCLHIDSFEDEGESTRDGQVCL